MHPYIVKAKRGINGTATVSELRVMYAPKYRTKRMFGPAEFRMREVEKYADDKSNFDLSLRRLTDDPAGCVRRSDGGTGFRFSSLRIPATREGVSAHVRRLRPQEMEEIAEFDQLIEAKQQELRDLRSQRDVMVRDAWGRAHKITVKELHDAVKVVRA